ncbi:DUF4258 domain-containing protein [Nanoarchaeota archaeon]
MEITFTYHAKIQMEERKILPIWVEETIKYPDETRRNRNKFYVVKKLNGKVLKVVYVRENYIKVITSFFLK